jgi:hypothetical protein
MHNIKNTEMTLDDRIDEVLNDEPSKNFLTDQLPTLRDNILETERRISKNFIATLSFIAISELIRLGIIQKLTFFTTEIDKLDIVLIVLPCIVAYYSHSLFNQLLLRKSLYGLYSKIIKKSYPQIYEHNIDDYLITHLNSSIETILTRKPKNVIKNIIEILSAPFILFFQWIPIIYSYFLLSKLCGQHSPFIFWISFLITTAFYLRATLILIGYFKEQGGLFKLIREIVDEWK